MACDRGDLENYLQNFTDTDPADAILCSYASDAGAGMGEDLFVLFLFGFVGLALSIRTSHPGPILIVGVLTIGAVASRIPGAGVNIVALAMLVAIAGVGLYLYQRSQRAL